MIGEQAASLRAVESPELIASKLSWTPASVAKAPAPIGSHHAQGPQALGGGSEVAQQDTLSAHPRLDVAVDGDRASAANVALSHEYSRGARRRGEDLDAHARPGGAKVWGGRPDLLPARKRAGSPVGQARIGHEGRGKL